MYFEVKSDNEDTKYFIVMELANGISLRNAMSDDKTRKNVETIMFQEGKMEQVIRKPS